MINIHTIHSKRKNVEELLNTDEYDAIDNKEDTDKGTRQR